MINNKTNQHFITYNHVWVIQPSRNLYKWYIYINCGWSRLHSFIKMVYSYCRSDNEYCELFWRTLRRHVNNRESQGNSSWTQVARFWFTWISRNCHFPFIYECLCIYHFISTLVLCCCCCCCCGSSRLSFSTLPLFISKSFCLFTRFVVLCRILWFIYFLNVCVW